MLPILRANMRQFGDYRYSIFPAALSDHDEDGWLEICHRNLGECKLMKTPNANATKVSVRSADSFFASLGLEKLDLVKIDVEGHEAKILKASKVYLQRL